MVKSLMARQHSISTIIKEEDDPKCKLTKLILLQCGKVGVLKYE